MGGDVRWVIASLVTWAVGTLACEGVSAACGYAGCDGCGDAALFAVAAYNEGGRVRFEMGSCGFP